MDQSKNRQTDVHATHRPTVDLPTEVKLKILEEVGQLDPFTYRDLGMVWRDVLPAVRQVHFGHVVTFFRDASPESAKRVEKLRDLLLASPCLAASIQGFTIIIENDNNHKPVWQNLAVQLLQLLTNLNHLSLRLSGVDFRGSTFFEIMSKLSQLEDFNLDLSDCHVDINRVLQSASHSSLRNVAIRFDERVVLVTSKSSNRLLNLEHLEIALDRRIGEWLSDRECSAIGSVQTLTEGGCNVSTAVRCSRTAVFTQDIGSPYRTELKCTSRIGFCYSAIHAISYHSARILCRVLESRERPRHRMADQRSVFVGSHRVDTQAGSVLAVRLSRSPFLHPFQMHVVRQLA
ncbi:hypothetical protein BDZ89DRAFT_1075776 [Hymenopellis radicata]|nr:hypothetical protein BDZ89DRAFT_1075776 [Hymenopellis radicata]